MRKVLMAIGVAMLVPAGVDAQWLNYPDPRIPRKADGTPNLAGPAPKTATGEPDLSGVWLRIPSTRPSLLGATSDIARFLIEGSEIQMLPTTASTYERIVGNFGAGHPSERCLPKTFPNQVILGLPIQIVQNRGITFMLFEEFNHFRQILTDGRGFPSDMNPTWFGYSIGKWDGDTFVVETTGFREGLWLDGTGHTATDKLRTTERYRRRSMGQLEMELTVNDPGAYKQPWTVRVEFSLIPDTTLLEFVCENEKDSQHIIRGK